uniref:Uncharacterized protein n=1 Tax=Glossina pallidipes TaxID=7398 RepID=A0A1B0A0M2_GLOPL
MKYLRAELTSEATEKVPFFRNFITINVRKAHIAETKWNEELYSSTTLAVAYNSSSFSHKNNKTSKQTADTARRPQKSLNCSDWNLSTTTLQNSIIFDQQRPQQQYQ